LEVANAQLVATKVVTPLRDRRSEKDKLKHGTAHHALTQLTVVIRSASMNKYLTTKNGSQDALTVDYLTSIRGCSSDVVFAERLLQNVTDSPVSSVEIAPMRQLPG
jgi:hypothetical protein